MKTMTILLYLLVSLFVIMFIACYLDYLCGYNFDKPICSPAGVYYPGNDKIVIYTKNTSIFYNSVVRHELCHRKQNREDRIKYDALGGTLNEFECLVVGVIPWKIKERIN